MLDRSAGGRREGDLDTHLVPGPNPQCGYLVQPDTPARPDPRRPAATRDWTGELNYLAQ